MAHGLSCSAACGRYVPQVGRQMLIQGPPETSAWRLPSTGRAAVSCVTRLQSGAVLLPLGLLCVPLLVSLFLAVTASQGFMG